MYIYQNQLKSQLKEIQFVRTEYQGENTELIAKTLTEAFGIKNGFYKELNLEYDQLYEEFKSFLINRTYKWILVYYEKESYEKNIYNIIAVVSYTDINEVRLTEQQLSIKDFNIIPKLSLVRQYVRYKALKDFFDRYNPKQGECFVIGTFGFSSKFMGSKHSMKIFLDSIEFMYSQGFKFGFGWTENDIAKNLYDKNVNVWEEEQLLTDIYVEETKTYPYQNNKFKKALYLGDVGKSIIQLRKILGYTQNVSTINTIQ
ncbi:unnamed protein product [Paramecium sonneborni]|uniref:Uncharacterized protein n=1 Tax=Paramecium sonneborni TaxID=65129 RepID=A0A8S1PDF7_9CILI|nr:unnamed protein product [Paramecium sonneborni]